ncbi:MAG: bifunctional folylpolyglutamate synthase/dihydrofolate synthase [Armatimonadota bacterium]
MHISFHEAVEYMQGLKRFGIKLGNQRIEALLAMLGNPHRQFKSVHIAGTNGKGSTCTMTAAIMRASGYRTGVYLSPYVFDLRERVQVDGQMIPEENFAELVSRIQPMIQELAHTPMGQVTEFELKTALAFTWFAEQKVDIAVIEVGMGGLLDCTNVITPEVCAITSIGLDHMERLGNTLGAIAAQKAGIIKPGVPVVSAVVDDEPRKVIEAKALESGSPYWLVMPEGVDLPEAAGENVIWSYEPILGSPGGVTITKPKHYAGSYQLGLIGKYQASNAAIAATICSLLASNSFSNVSHHAIKGGLAEAWLPGRMQVIGRNPWTLLDGAHNPQALAKLLDAVKESVPHNKRIVVLGMTQGHQPDHMAGLIRDFADVVILTAPRDRRGMSLKKLAAPFRQFKGQLMTSIDANTALQHADSIAERNDLILLTGSFYLVGDVDFKKNTIDRPFREAVETVQAV